MNGSTKIELIDAYVAAYNTFDIDGMLAVLSPDVRFKNYTNGEQIVVARRMVIAQRCPRG